MSRCQKASNIFIKSGLMICHVVCRNSVVNPSGLSALSGSRDFIASQTSASVKRYSSCDKSSRGKSRSSRLITPVRMAGMPKISSKKVKARWAF
jgi:hypothetical protein